LNAKRAIRRIALDLREIPMKDLLLHKSPAVNAHLISA
jgi:hypothetical protein